MRKYEIQATVSHKGPQDAEEKTYGASIEVPGPDSLEEFTKEMGESGVLDCLVKNFKNEQAAILRSRIAEKIGKVKPGTGGRLANAVPVDL